MYENHETINIAFNSDNNYAPYLMILIKRILLLRKSNYSIRFYILDAGICSKNKNIIQEEIIKKHSNTEINYINVNIEEYKSLPHTVDYISPATYARLQIAEHLKNISKVIYLDIDIVLNQDIYLLWEQDTRGLAIAACIDPFIEELNPYYKEIIGLPQKHLYFNAGIIIFDLDICRQFRLFEKCIEWSLAHKGKFDYQDQDILNGVLVGNVRYINSRFNFTINHLGIIKKSHKENIYNPKLPICIYHHVGSGKPWNEKNTFNGSRTFYNTYLMLEKNHIININNPSLKIKIKRILKEIKNKYLYKVY